MNTAASLFDVRQPSLRGYVEEYVSLHSVTEVALVQVIENLVPSILKEKSAAKEVRGLFHDKSLELLGGVCTWKKLGSSPSRRAMKRGRTYDIRVFTQKGYAPWARLRRLGAVFDVF